MGDKETINALIAKLNELANGGQNRDGQVISGQKVDLDGSSFVGTTFRDCELTYSGGGIPNLENARVEGRSTFALSGPALNMMSFFIRLNGWAPKFAEQLYKDVGRMVQDELRPSGRN